MHTSLLNLGHNEYTVLQSSDKTSVEDAALHASIAVGGLKFSLLCHTFKVAFLPVEFKSIHQIKAFYVFQCVCM